ncbi:MAG: AzlD domain-containing protein [Desulfobacterales bacterium]|nr:AzlD domain-containing protein [Desulfobacterales bacterium]
MEKISIEWVIIGMALITYFTRVSGFWLAEKTGKLPEKVENTLKYIPGTIIISIIAPAVFAQGTINAMASFACFLISLKSDNIVIVMVTGVAIVALMRNYIPL